LQTNSEKLLTILMAYYKDLVKKQWWHNTNLSYDPSVPGEFTAVMIGWIGNEVPSVGEIDDKMLSKLEWACSNRVIDQGWLGEHECEVCNSHTDRGEILIVYNNTMYVAPRILLHYITAHSYLPPGEFLNAVDKISGHEI